MRTLLMLIAFLFIGYTAKAQDKKPEFKKVERTNNIKKSVSSPIPLTQISSNTPKKSGSYYLNDQVILEKLNVKTIPSDYPQYNAKLSKSDNVNLIEKWMLNNKHLIKDKYKALYK
ncbi:MAG: hypothetical protein HRT89_21830 [Lentisphaeria bacterium]|nr:hypothetical protein [Lentisphaeria bacterium]